MAPAKPIPEEGAREEWRGRAEEKGWGMIKKINTNGLMPLCLGRLSQLNADVKDRRLNSEQTRSEYALMHCGGALDGR